MDTILFLWLIFIALCMIDRTGKAAENFLGSIFLMSIVMFFAYAGFVVYEGLH